MVQYKKYNLAHLPSWDTGTGHRISYCLGCKFENHNENHQNHKLDWLNTTPHHCHHYSPVLRCTGRPRVHIQWGIDCWCKDDLPSRTGDKSRDFHLTHQNNPFFHHIFCSILYSLRFHMHIRLLGSIWEVLQWMYHNIVQQYKSKISGHHISDIKMPRIFRETLVS